MKVAINPGTGHVIGSTEQHALMNMKHLIKDCLNSDASYLRCPDLDDGGRFGFIVWNDRNICHQVLMPGRPLSEVRFTGDADQNAWDFHRLYMDGASWLWKYVVNIMFLEEE